MRALLSSIGLLVASTAWAGEALIVKPAAPTPAPSVASAPAAPASDPAPAPAKGDATPAAEFAGIYNAPLFGRSGPGTGSLAVSEAALRFYAQQRNYGRVDAEIRRLKLLYPNWKPPRNPYAAGGDGEAEQPLWDLLGAGRLDELRRTIKARQVREPGWVPSNQLSDKMHRQEGIAGITALSDSGNWPAVLDAANRTPEALGCASVDADWRVAEAFAQTGRASRAFEVDQAILQSCKNRDERTATIQKSFALLPPDQVEQLIAMGDTGPDGVNEFEPLRAEMARHLVGEVLAGHSDADVPAAALAVLTNEALKSSSSADAALLGWYYLARKDFASAETWFKLGVSETEGDPKLIEGRVAALRGLGRTAEAEALAAAWRDRSPALRASYVSMVLDRMAQQPGSVTAADRAALETFISAARDGGGAQALAWAHYAARDFTGSLEWFRHATEWAASDLDPAVREKIGEGTVLSLRESGRVDEAWDLAAGSDLSNDGMRGLATELSLRLLGASGATLAPARLTAIESLAESARSPTIASALGWYRLARKTETEAAVWFKAALDWRPEGAAPDGKAVEGYILALRAAGRPDEAVAVLTTWRDSVPPGGTLVLDTMVDDLARGGSALSPAQVAEAAHLVEADGSPRSAAALGWYYFGAGDAAQAETWFKTAVKRADTADPDSKSLEGLSLALRASGRTLDAMAFMAAWSQRLPVLKGPALDIAVDTLPGVKSDQPLDGTLVGQLDGLGLAERSAHYAAARGWYGYTMRDWRGAADWFGHAVEWSPTGKADVKLAEGYGLALRFLCRYDDSKAVTEPWIDAPEGALVRGVYIDATAEQIGQPAFRFSPDRDDLTRFPAAVMAARSANGAQALAWYAYRTGQYRSGVAWFGNAMQWGPSEPTAFGFALAYRRLGDREGLGRVLAEFAGRYPVLDAFRDANFRETDPRFSRFTMVNRPRRSCTDPNATGDEASSADPLPPVAPTDAALVSDRPAVQPARYELPPVEPEAAPPAAAPAERRKPVPVVVARPVRSRPDPMVADPEPVAAPADPRSGCASKGGASGDAAWRVRGWCLLDKDRPAEAAAAFERSGSRDRDGAFGQAIALLRSGDIATATAIAGRTDLDGRQRRQIDSEILWRQALQAFEGKRWHDTIELLDRRGRLTTDSREQATLRGWALYQLGEYEAARTLFDAVDRRLSDKDSRHALAVIDDAMRPKGR